MPIVIEKLGLLELERLLKEVELIIEEKKSNTPEHIAKRTAWDEWNQRKNSSGAVSKWNFFAAMTALYKLGLAHGREYASDNQDA